MTRLPREVGFDIAVIARLCIADGADGSPPEVLFEERAAYARDLAEEYEAMVEADYLAAEDSTTVGLPERPNMVTREIGKVSRQLADLERYRDQLIVVARGLASAPATARAVAQQTRLSHSTVVRMVTPEAIAEVSATVAPLVEQLLEEMEPGEAPGFYLRLRSAAEAGRR